jgi:DNA primase
MSFPAEFLEEIRTRLRVSEIVGKRLKLVRKGREYLGICPFHNDTKPSLSVVDEKNFYHCFACGAHGDIITFTMEMEGLSFPEAVEKLAGLANLEVPRQTPEAREREVVRKTLGDVMEAACKFYEEVLWSPQGRVGLDYLLGRGLSEATIRRFRLGYAPDGRTALRQAMSVKAIEPAMLLEAGLLRKPEDRDETYDYFRGRVLFPITDRRGRVIAFGGRTLGDGQPKYLNSPDTPLFHKGRVLYGLAQAREPASKAGEVIVAEGYMDVIALSQGGFPHAVAPLGTALTEDQITELWRLAREPVICFDGDAAGQKAAARAADRALPILKPGHSLRFVSLPPGEDPDDLLKRGGPKAMRDLLEAATGMADFIWDQELRAHPLDTPERQADFMRRTRGRVREIADKTVQEAYGDAIERRIRQMRDAGRGGGRAAPGRFARPVFERPAPRGSATARARVTAVLGQRQKQSVVAAIITHPDLMEEFGEALGYLQFDDPFLDKLRQDILENVPFEAGLDAAGLRRHLTGLGYSEDCDGLLGPAILGHAAFARPDASLEQARAGVRELLARMGKHQLEEQLADAQQAVAAEFNEANWNRLASLRAALAAVNSSSPLEDAV